MSLLIVGSVAFDSIETPFGSAERVMGGAATYISLAASYLKNNIGIVSVVGNDYTAEHFKIFEDKNIDISGIERRADEKSFFWHGKYHMDMNSRDSLVTELNVLEDFNPVVPEKFQNAEYVMLGNMDPEVQRSVIEQMAKKPKLIVMDTMNFWMEIKMEELKKTIAMVDVLTINDEEARQLSGEYSLKKAAKAILKMGPKFIVIKKGEHGALLFSENDIFFVPALPLEEVFDPTGAGDTFAGGFIGYLASVNKIDVSEMKYAIIYGSALASCCVEKFGPEALIDLKQQEIKDRCQEFINLVKVDVKF